MERGKKRLKLWRLNCGGSRFLVRNGFHDFAGLNAAGADIHAAYGAVIKTDLNALKVREKTAAGDTGSLFTDTAGLFRETAAGDGTPNNRFFIADGTMLHRADIIAIRCNLARPFFYYILVLPNPPGGRMFGRKKTKIPFEYFAPQAGKVGLGGTFNGWDPFKASMKKDREGKWKAVLELPPGRYEYRFWVDGIWQNDQKPVECVPNPFGTWNCVIQVH